MTLLYFVSKISLEEGCSKSPRGFRLICYFMNIKRVIGMKGQEYCYNIDTKIIIILSPRLYNKLTFYFLHDWLLPIAIICFFFEWCLFRLSHSIRSQLAIKHNPKQAICDPRNCLIIP